MAKSEKKENGKKEEAKTSPTPVATYEPSELVIKEVMFQKGCSREEAIRILKNPTPHK